MSPAGGWDDSLLCLVIRRTMEPAPVGLGCRRHYHPARKQRDESYTLGGRPDRVVITPDWLRQTMAAAGHVVRDPHMLVFKLYYLRWHGHHPLGEYKGRRVRVFHVRENFPFFFIPFHWNSAGATPARRHNIRDIHEPDLTLLRRTVHTTLGRR